MKKKSRMSYGCEKWEYSLEVRFRAAKCFQDQIHLCIALRFLMNEFDGV